MTLWCFILADEPQLQSRQEPLWIPSQQTVTHKETYRHLRSTATTSIVVILTRHSFPVISGNQADQGKLWIPNALERFPWKMAWREKPPHLDGAGCSLFSVSFFAFWKMGLFLSLVRAGTTTLPLLHTGLRNPSWKHSYFCLFSSSGSWGKRERRDETPDVLQMQQIVFDHNFPILWIEWLWRWVSVLPFIYFFKS